MKRTRIALNARLFARMIYMLEHDAPTAQDISDELGFHVTTVQRYLSALKKEGMVRVIGRREDTLGRASVKTWKLGKGRDAPGRPKSRAEISRAHRERKAQQVLLQRMAGPIKEAA